jgi:2,3,4,5-tetrahydropyridine-2,6-dicarboxylate N-succinyltransferase
MTPHGLSVLETEIEAAWEARDTLSPKTTGPLRAAVELAIELLDSGRARVAEKADGDWIVHQWLKKAVLLSFRLNANGVMHGAPSLGGGVGPWWDKVGNKFDGWDADRFEAAGFTNAMTKASKTRNRMGADRNANKGMVMKQPKSLTEISIQRVAVCVIQSGLMGSMRVTAEFRATLE